MERVVDLIDRQARLINGEKRLPADDYVYAKNEGEDTYFYYDSASNTYYTTLKARYPAIDNYLLYEKDTYTDGVIGVYLTNNGAYRERIYLENTNMYATFNPNDANLDESTVTFYNIPLSIVTYLYNEENLKRSPDNLVDYYAFNPVDYHRNYVAGEGP
jgi:hypothetical protein